MKQVFGKEAHTPAASQQPSYSGAAKASIDLTGKGTNAYKMSDTSRTVTTCSLIVLPKKIYEHQIYA